MNEKFHVRLKSMFPDNKNKLIPKGDYVTAGEALMDDEREIRSRCESVHDVVANNVIPLFKALKAYNISLEQYFGFLMLKNLEIKLPMDTATIAAVAAIILKFMDTSAPNMDSRTKKWVEDMRQLNAAG